MPRYLPLLLGHLCLLCLATPGLQAEDCIPTVFARRNYVEVPLGGSLSLSCKVQHCGVQGWTGGWAVPTQLHFLLLEPSANHILRNRSLSTNQTELFIHFLSANQSDSGWYGCRVKWANGGFSVGHMTCVNVTEAAPSERTVQSRLLLCGSACLCLPLILGLARCLRSKVKPKPQPRTRSLSLHQLRTESSNGPQLNLSVPQSLPVPPPLPRCPTAAPKHEQKIEMVYASLSPDVLEQARCVAAATREPVPTTIYSSLLFPTS